MKDPSFLVSIALVNERSENIFDEFLTAIESEKAVYPPILGWHNCPANLKLKSIGDFSTEKNGEFETYGFVIAGKHVPKNISGEFRIGFDKLPTYQDDDFWNLPDKYLNIIYPDYPHSIKVDGVYYEYKVGVVTEKWCLI